MTDSSPPRHQQLVPGLVRPVAVSALPLPASSISPQVLPLTLPPAAAVSVEPAPSVITFKLDDLTSQRMASEQVCVHCYFYRDWCRLYGQFSYFVQEQYMSDLI